MAVDITICVVIRISTCLAIYVPIGNLCLLFGCFPFFFKGFNCIHGTIALKGVRDPERSSDAIPQGEELPVVVVIEKVMIRVVSAAVDQWL